MLLAYLGAKQSCRKKITGCIVYKSMPFSANIESKVPYSQRYLFNAISDTNHNANPTNPNHNSKGNPNSTNPATPTIPNTDTKYHCEYGTLNSMFARVT